MSSHIADPPSRMDSAVRRPSQHTCQRESTAPSRRRTRTSLSKSLFAGIGWLPLLWKPTWNASPTSTTVGMCSRISQPAWGTCPGADPRPCGGYGELDSTCCMAASTVAARASAVKRSTASSDEVRRRLGLPGDAGCAAEAGRAGGEASPSPAAATKSATAAARPSASKLGSPDTGSTATGAAGVGGWGDATLVVWRRLDENGSAAGHSNWPSASSPSL